MLSMLSRQTAPVPFGKKAQLKAQNQSNMSYTPRTKTAQAGPTYYLVTSSGSYILDSQRPPHGHAGHSSTKAASGYPQPAATQYVPAPATAARPDFRASTSNQQVVSTGDRSNSRNTSPSRSFKIYPDTPMLDSFIYERSEDAESDTLTCYSNSSVDTLLQFPTTESSKQASQPTTTRRSSVMLITGSSDAVTLSTSRSAPDSPHPPSISLPQSSSSFAGTSQGRTLPRSGEDGPRSRSGSGDSGSSRRRGSGSDSERPTVPAPGSSPTHSNPQRTIPGGRFPDRANVPPTTVTTGSRDIPPGRRDSDPRMQIDAPRNRRLSGAVIPTGFGVLPGERLSPPNGRDSVTVVPAGLGTADRHSPPVLRGVPAPEAKRERYSPEREISVSTEFAHERRPNGIGIDVFPAPPPGSFYDRDRPPLRRGSQSSGSTSPRERHSPQDEASRGVVPATGPVPTIRSRTLSSSRINKDDAPKPIFVAGLEPSKMVRFSEKLICPSPVPLDRRRKGWFNKKGDQLWTNDGVFVAPEPGTEYPIELSEYPDVGAGWQNEEGIRIDMQHRLIPKVPLRPALKRGGSSASSQQQQQQTGPARPETRIVYSSTSIREEA